MKSFKMFRLDAANHLLWRDGQRVPIAPKAFDVLAYLVDHAGRVVTQDELLQALWPETYVNPEVLRKYILESRKILGDRAETPEFIETLPKRGYRFIAPVSDESMIKLPVVVSSYSTKGHITDEIVGTATASLEQERSSSKHSGWNLVLLFVMPLVLALAVTEYFLVAKKETNAFSSKNTSLVVLPFADMSPSKDEEYLSDGLTEELIDDLARVPGLKVVGRSSAFQFKGRNEDLREIGRKLGVANVLEGSVRRERNHVRITADLIEADDGFQLWSQTYDREVTDIFAIQDEIAFATTEALQVKLLGGIGQPVTSNLRSTNAEAYQAYLLAKYLSGQAQNKEDFSKAVARIAQAIKLDEQYAPAWSLRSSVKTMMVEDGLIDPAQGYREARDDAERAIGLDPTAASGYLALATIQIDHDWDWDAADTCLTTASALEPGGTDVLRIRSHLSLVFGNVNQAIKLEQQAVMLDPLHINSHLGLGYVLYLAGRYDEAQAEMKKALELDSHAAFVHVSMGKIFLKEGKPRKALVEIQKEPTEWGKLIGQALVYHALGREQDSTAALSELIARHATDAAYQIAQVYAYRGESQTAFEWLDRAYELRDAGMTQIKADPLFEGLRHDLRYTELLKKMRLAT